jgi:peptide/nickel transport system substrate-binding protein
MHKKVLTLSVLVLAIALVAACAQPAAPAGEQAAVSEPAAAEQVLRVATGSSGAASFDFNAMQAGADQQNWSTLQFIQPMYFDVDNKLNPGVFSAWEVNEEATVWTFTIDPRAVWSDGTPITAQQVVDSWQVQIAPINSVGRIRGYLGNVEGFNEAREAAAAEDIIVEVSGLQAVDDSTVQVTLASPDPAFHWRIATAHLAPNRADKVLEHGWTEYWRPENNPIVSGPYVLTAFDPDLQTAEMEPNPNWWMDEGPHLDKITFKFVPDAQVIGAMVLNDEIDVSLAAIPIALKPQVPDFFRPIQAVGFNSFWLSTAPEPTSDPLVRKALALSVDWNQVFEATFPEGTGVPTTQPMDDSLNCWDPELTGYTYDPEAAQEALAASSYGSAENMPKLRVTPRGNDPYNNRALQAAMEFWRQNLGITNVEFQESPDGFGDDLDKLNLSRDDVVIRFPDGATYMWTAAHSGGPVSAELLGGYQNPELEALLDEALTLSPDDPQRCELTRQAQDLFIDDYLMLHFGKLIMTLNARDYVKGYEKGPDVTIIESWKVRIEK